ncbi:MAG: phosphatase PAP2 family protein [Candidatus Shapirobacteria bacterium]
MIEFLNSNLLIVSLVLFPLVFSFYQKRKIFFKFLVPSLIATTFLVEILKKITAISRPFVENPAILGVQTNIPSGFSFPSLHTALATFFAWSLAFLKPTLSWIGFAFLFLIAFSRAHLGLHYFQDLIGGFAIATLIFWVFFIIHEQKIVQKISHASNLRRKIVHLFYGFALVYLIEYQILDKTLFFVLFLVWAIITLASTIWLPQKIRNLIIFFERDQTRPFLGEGCFLFTASCFAAFLLFPQNIAQAAIVNLAVGDSVNALVGFYFNSKKKRIEASLAALFATALVSLQFISLPIALTGAAATSILEYSEPKIRGKKINDNLLIPLVSGAVIWLALNLA